MYSLHKPKVIQGMPSAQPENRKVAILISDVHRGRLTGQQKIGFTLARHLSNVGVRVLVVSNAPTCKSWEIDALNHDLELFVISGEATISSYLRNLNNIGSAVGRFNPDIIHGHGMRMSLITAFLGKILGKPTVQTIYDIDIFSRTPTFIKIFGLFFINQIICTSGFIKNYLIDAKIAAEKIVVLPYGIEDVWFSLDKLIDQPQNTKGATVLFWGDAREDRGIATLLEAIPKILKRFPYANFTFAIRRYFPPYSRRRIREIARKYPIKIIDYSPSQHISEVVSSADVIVFPYNVTTIQPPLTLLESLAAGKAVVTTDVQANRELMDEDGKGRLIEPKNSDQLAEAVVGLLSNEDEKKKIATVARSFARATYGWNNVLTKMIKLYNMVLKEDKTS